MNFNKYHVSRNLFDGTDISGTINNTIYKNDFVYANLSQGTYTLAFDLETTATSAYASSIGVGATTYSKDIQVQTGKTDGHFVFTFTISEEDAGKNLYARFARFGTAVTITYTASNIMLNLGSTPLPYEPYSPEVWHDTPHYIHNTSTDTITTLPADIYPTDTTATVGLKGQASQQSGTTTVSSKSVTVSSLESGTNYALFPKADFPNAVVGDTINIVVGGTSYSQKVMKIDASYVYIENRTV